MDDYYAILGLDRSASTEEIAQKIKSEMRIWPKRAANPDLSRRQEAERRVQLIGEAKSILLDADARRSYDRKLATAGPQSTTTTPTGSGTTDWVVLARRYLSSNDYSSALYAAREARNSGVATAEVWSLLCRANTGLNKLDEALYEAKQAADISPADPQMHIDLGTIHETRDEWEPAYKAYEAAHRLAPEEDGPRMAMALVRAEGGRIGDALTEMELLYADCRDREQVGRQLAFLLVRAGEVVPRVQDGTTFTVTSREEIAQIRQLTNRARAVTDDPHALAAVVELETYVNACDSRPFSFRRLIADGFFRVGLLPLVIAMCTCSQSLSWAIVLLAIASGLIFTGVQRARPPVWKVNYLVHQGQLTNS